MYSNIAPNFTVKNTISHPIRQEEVIGFVGRNTKLGREAIIMKQDAVVDGLVHIPTGPAENLAQAEAELAVLKEFEVYSMAGTDFALKHQIHTLEGRGSTAEVYIINEDHDLFRNWDRNTVEISN